MGKLYNFINKLTNNYFKTRKLRRNLIQKIITEFPEKYGKGKTERVILECIISDIHFKKGGEPYFTFHYGPNEYEITINELKFVIDDLALYH